MNTDFAPELAHEAILDVSHQYVTPPQQSDGTSNQAEPQHDEIDSGLDEDENTLSETKSLSPSVKEFAYVFDRRYHSDRFKSKYWAPNDEPQRDFMSWWHGICYEAFDQKHFRAHIRDDAQAILDVGTGSGAWVVDVSEAYRSSVVTGIDMSPIMPEEVPPNVLFEIDDFNEPWTFQPNSFDYIHMRFLTGSIKDWEYIMKQAFDCLKPGGILESSEPSFLVESSDGTVNEESAWSGWYNIFERYGSTSGQTFSVVPQNVQVNAMNQAGFQNLEVFECEIPIGAWPQTEEKKKLEKPTPPASLVSTRKPGFSSAAAKGLSNRHLLYA
ncbi:uncharacterized protein CTRU02_215559 [Colletotrichum truncatum]|uniref:Uncharacterized protein n=1 Tax=Colletotrichum truncatum TaxID=5467 RepID=A0ACC3YC15_COLTU